jgi:hypothetical protein
MRTKRLFATYEIAYGVDDVLYFGRESNSSTPFDDLEVIECLAPDSGVVVPIVTVDSRGYDRLPSSLEVLPQDACQRCLADPAFTEKHSMSSALQDRVEHGATLRNAPCKEAQPVDWSGWREHFAQTEIAFDFVHSPMPSFRRGYAPASYYLQ